MKKLSRKMRGKSEEENNGAVALSVTLTYIVTIVDLGMSAIRTWALNSVHNSHLRPMMT